MSFKKLVLSGFAAAALTSSAFAGGTAVSAVSLEADGTGDYLVFPNYFANEANWATNLKVVNTNASYSVIAKVVVRESRFSHEKLDFLIYLSPNDVWEGVLRWDGSQVVMTSTDASTVFGGVPASATAPHTVPLFAPKTFTRVDTSTVSENNTRGYVEVFGIGMTNSTVVYNGVATSLGSHGFDKSVLYKAYKDGSAAMTAVVDDTLYGMGVINADNSNGKLAMTYPAIAFDGVTGSGTPLVFNSAVATDTTFQQNLTSSTDSASKLTSVQNELSKTITYVTYNGSATPDETVLLANFLTKKYIASADKRDFFEERAITDGKAILKSGALNADAETNWYIKYSVQPWDMEEHTPTGGEVSGGSSTTYTCEDEVCYIDVTANTPYGSGYVLYGFYGGAISDKFDTPYIPQVMTAIKVGGSNVTNMVYPQYVEGANPLPYSVNSVTE
jgi:hypothetical protein